MFLESVLRQPPALNFENTQPMIGKGRTWVLSKCKELTANILHCVIAAAVGEGSWESYLIKISYQVLKAGNYQFTAHTHTVYTVQLVKRSYLRKQQYTLCNFVVGFKEKSF